MAQEFTIKSPDIEDKINQLLPSQGGFGAGVDFSASTMVIPIVDLTETAEGSTLRQDLQTALSHDSATTFQVTNATTTIINTTGYFRITADSALTGNGSIQISISDGTTSKVIVDNTVAGATAPIHHDFIVQLDAGDSVIVVASNSNVVLTGSSRQIADLDGNLINP